MKYKTFQNKNEKCKTAEEGKHVLELDIYKDGGVHAHVTSTPYKIEACFEKKNKNISYVSSTSISILHPEDPIERLNANKEISYFLKLKEKETADV